MFKAVLASLRLAFAFVCVGIGLILSAQWFGLVPDSRIELERSRHSTCHHLAIGALDDVRNERWLKIDSVMRAIVDYDETLLSVGLRTRYGSLPVSTENHERCWKAVQSGKRTLDSSIEDIPVWAKSPTGRNPKSSSSRQFEPVQDEPVPAKSPVMDADAICLEIPIVVRNEPWGQMEFCFRETQSGFFGSVLDAGISELIVFFLICGMGSYTCLVMRMVGVFSRTQVVPDRVRQALDTLAEGLLVLDQSGKIILANENFLSINGFESEELIDRLAADLPWFFPSTDPRKTSPDDAFPWTRAIQQRQSVTAEILRMTGRDGIHRVFSVNAGPIGDANQQRGVLVTFQDVTHVEKHRVELENMLTMLRRSKDEIQKKNQELEVLATRDALTGCLNRRAFFESMEPMIDQYRRESRSLSCFMVDIDHFKSVNDTYGHHTGDEVLREVSKRLRDLFEQQHLVCRYGGEEFCVVLPGLDLEQAHREAERTRSAIMNIRLADPAELRLTASIGVSELRFGATEIQMLINQADECLYVAKRGGRNQSVLYDPDRVSVLGEKEPQTAHITPGDLIKLPFSAVMALVSALAYRDPATAEHSRRVANSCVKAAKGLFSQQQTYLLEIAALLHDIGKIGVPDTVLHKSGPLDENDWKLLRRHNSAGIDMIAATFRCGELESIIRAHHALSASQFNGFKLRVDRVSEVAQLLNMADWYDSMTSDRAFQRGCSSADAIKKLRQNIGILFDEGLVERFIRRTTGEPNDSVLGFATSRGIALAITKPVASRIGEQIEELANAIDRRDVDSVQRLTRQLNEIAAEHCLLPIMECSDRIFKAIESTSDCVATDELLRDTLTLINLCRSTQNAHITQNTDR